MNTSPASYAAPAQPPAPKVNNTVVILATGERGEVTSIHSEFEHSVFVTVQGQGTRIYTPDEVEVYEAPAVLDCAIPLLDLYEVELEAGECLPLELEDAFEYISVGDKVRVNPGYGRRMFEGFVEVSYPLYQRAIVRHWRGNYRMEVGVDELELLVKAGALELETALFAEASNAV